MRGNLFELAELQLIRENKRPSSKLILNYAIKIRQWLDKHRGISDKILAGASYYQYDNRFIIKGVQDVKI